MKPSERIKELTNLNLRDFPNLTHVENAVNAMVTYLDEQWGKNQKRIVSNYHQGAGGCCKECEIYLDYKDSYQCNNDDCSCHKEEVVECQWENCLGGEYCEKHSLQTHTLEVKEKYD